MTLRSGSRTKTETCPVSPKLTGPWVIAISLAFRAAKRHVSVARIFFWNVHQHIRARLTGIGVEDAVSVSDDRNVVAFGPAQRCGSPFLFDRVKKRGRPRAPWADRAAR